MFRSMWMFLGAGALALGSVACGGSDEAGDAAAPPEPVAELVDDWFAAADAGDGSVTDLYLPSGYHLYGDQRIDRDEDPAGRLRRPRLRTRMDHRHHARGR